MGEMTHRRLPREGETSLRSPAHGEVHSSCTYCPQLVWKSRMSHGNGAASWVHRLGFDPRLLHLLAV